MTIIRCAQHRQYDYTINNSPATAQEAQAEFDRLRLAGWFIYPLLSGRGCWAAKPGQGKCMRLERWRA
jgi:hypothetical protein